MHVLFWGWGTGHFVDVVTLCCLFDFVFDMYSNEINVAHMDSTQALTYHFKCKSFEHLKGNSTLLLGHTLPLPASMLQNNTKVSLISMTNNLLTGFMIILFLHGLYSVAPRKFCNLSYCGHRGFFPPTEPLLINLFMVL